MHKKLKKIVSFLILLILSGCLNYTQVTTIKTDNSGNMFIHYWMKWRSEKDSIIINQLGLFEKESIVKEFSSDYNKITNVEVYRDYSDSAIHGKVEFEFNDVDSLVHLKAFKGTNISIKNGDNNTKIFSQFIPPLATGFGIENDNFIITYIYYLPGNIISDNATSKSRNKLEWQYTLDEIGIGKYITATYRPYKLKETPPWIYYSALLVLTVVILFLFKKRKK